MATDDEILNGRSEATVDLVPRDDGDDGGSDDGDNSSAAPAIQPKGGSQRTQGNNGGGRGGKMRELENQLRSMPDSFRQMLDQVVSPLRSQLDQLRQTRDAVPQGRSQQSDPKEMLQGELNSLLQESARTDLSAERRNQIATAFAAKSAQIRKIEIAEAIKEHHGSQQQQPQSNQNTVQSRALAMLEDEHPEFFARGEEFTTRALTKIRAYVDHEVDVEERPRTLALYKEAAAKMRAKMGLGEIPDSSRNRAALLGPGAVRGNPGAQSKRGVTAPKAAVRAAMNSVPGMDMDRLARLAAAHPDKAIGED